MNIFFDTSALFQLYHTENNTQNLLNLLSNYPDFKIVISQITIAEMYSALFKKVKTGELNLEQAERFLPVLERDFNNFLVIPIESSIVHLAQKLLIRYATRGLRTLDAIQMGTAVMFKNDFEFALTSDRLLKQFLTEEGIKTKI